MVNETSEPVDWRNNPNDFLYHFGFGVATVEIPAVFGDTKVSFVLLSRFRQLFSSSCALAVVHLALPTTPNFLQRNVDSFVRKICQNRIVM